MRNFSFHKPAAQPRQQVDDTCNADPKRKCYDNGSGDELASASKQRKVNDGFDLGNFVDDVRVLEGAGI